MFGLFGCVPTPSGGISPSQLANLRRCESHGNYGAISKSKTYRGAYQFAQGTWNATASRHWPFLVGQDPAGASIEAQDAMARWLWHDAGRGRWPVCGRRV